MTARFSLGQTVATPGAIDALAESGQTPTEFLSRHISGDWGEVDSEDRQTNEDALIHGERLMSVYQTNKGIKIWIITEADRAVSTPLLPEEY